MKFFAWLKHWFRKAVAASSRPDFYRHIDGRAPAEAFGHLAMLTAVLWALPFMIFFFIGAHHGLKALKDGLKTHIPAGTVFTMKDGKFSDTLTSPIVIRDDEGTIIVNTATTTLALEEGESGIVINTNGVTQYDGVRRQEIGFTKAPDFSLSREQLEERIVRWMPLGLFLGSLLLICLVFILYMIGFLASVFAHALVLWLALKLFKRAWPLKRAFVASAFAATVPIALNAVLALLGLDDLHLLPNLAYWVILAWIVYDTVKRSDHAQTPIDRPHGGQ